MTAPVAPHAERLDVTTPSPAAEIGAKTHDVRAPRCIEPGYPLLQNTMCSLAARGAMLIGRGIGIVLISRNLQSHEFGAYALLLATYSILLSAGAIGLEQTNLYLAGRRKGRTPTLIGNSLVIGLVSGLACALLCVLATEMLRERIFTDVSLAAVLVTACALPIGIAHIGLTGVILGNGHFRYYAVLEAGKWTLYVAIVVTLAMRELINVNTALASYFVLLLAAVCVNVVVLSKWHGRIRVARWRVLRRIIALGRSMLTVQVTNVLGLRLDVYAVRFFGSMGMVGTYALAAQLTEILMHVARSLTLVVFSGTARGRDHEHLRVGMLMRWILIAALGFGIVLAVCREDFLRAVFGETALGSGPILALRLPGALVSALTLLFTGEFLGRGRPDLVVRGNAIGIGVLVLGSVLTVTWNTMFGAAVAFTLAAVCEVLWVSWRLRRERRQRPLQPQLAASA